MVTLPRSARLAVWGTAWIRGEVALEDVVKRVRGDDEPHEVVDVPGAASTSSLGAAVTALRSAGAESFRVALPAPGDPVGLAGPAELTADAVDAGEAVLAVGAPFALVPDVRAFGPPGDEGHFVTWTCRTATEGSLGPNLAEAEAELAATLRDAGDTLARLDIAAWRPEVATLLDDIRSATIGEPLPRVYPPRAQTVAARSTRVMAVVGFALQDDGGALSAGAADSRRAALTPLERAARHALVAACNALAP